MYTAKIAGVRNTIIKRSLVYASTSALTSGAQSGADYLFDDVLGWI